MLQSLIGLTDRVSRSWRLFLFAFVCVVVVLETAMWVQDNKMTPQTGYPAFDVQMSERILTPREVAEQAARYNEPARHAAWVLYALDTLFPFGVAVVETAMAAWGCRKLFPHRYDKIKPWLLLLYIFVPLDWLENAGYLAAINSGASISSTTAHAAPFFAQLKWIAIYSVVSTVLLLFSGGLVASVVNFARVRRRDRAR